MKWKRGKEGKEESKKERKGMYGNGRRNEKAKKG